MCSWEHPVNKIFFFDELEKFLNNYNLQYQEDKLSKYK